MATKSIAWNDGSGDYISITYTGNGNGAIYASSPENKGASRSKVITIETTKGGLVSRNVTIKQKASIFPIGDVKNYSYTGSYQEVELPAGQYKFQVWGAQGGSNAADPNHSITSKAGGKGGYSDGIITLSQKTTVRVYVGGKGTTANDGWAGAFNGGGAVNYGQSYYNATNHFITTTYGGGGGATDIRLSDGSLNSRMIVAGGGSGGCMAYEKIVDSGTDTLSLTSNTGYYIDAYSRKIALSFGEITTPIQVRAGDKVTITSRANSNVAIISKTNAQGSSYTAVVIGTGDTSGAAEQTVSYTADEDCYLAFCGLFAAPTGTLEYNHDYEGTYSQIGFAGGGASGLGNRPGTQNSSGGNGASFGIGATQYGNAYGFCSGAGGGGWYGGGRNYSNDYSNYVSESGGGSGFVNTPASAGNRPSGYTGLQLDSGTTYAGNTSFPAPGGGNETGHSGNGYARITRIS